MPKNEQNGYHSTNGHQPNGELFLVTKNTISRNEDIVTTNHVFRYEKATTTPKRRGRPKNPDAKSAAERMRAYRRRQKEERHHRTQFTGEQEWYTPLAYLEAVRQVLGVIDLDPASSPEAQQRVQAVRYYTAQDNALICAWQGHVFLNPPYNQPLIEYFVLRLVAEVEAQHVCEAILLTHNYTDTKWFHRAEATAAAICFTRGRIKFESAEGKVAAPTQGQAFFYFGQNRDGFRDIFANFGMVR